MNNTSQGYHRGATQQHAMQRKPTVSVNALFSVNLLGTSVYVCV